jgi:hypothetical protein
VPDIFVCIEKKLNYRFFKSPKYKISRKSVRWEMDGRTDSEKLRVVLRHFANEHKHLALSRRSHKDKTWAIMNSRGKIREKHNIFKERVCNVDKTGVSAVQQQIRY